MFMSGRRVPTRFVALHWLSGPGRRALPARPGRDHRVARLRFPRPGGGRRPPPSWISAVGSARERLRVDEPALRRGEPVHLTGGMADHRLRLACQPGRRLHHGPGPGNPRWRDARASPAPGSPQAALRQAAAFDLQAGQSRFERAWDREVAADLRAHAGKGIIVAGRRQPPIVHALAFALNATLWKHRQDCRASKPPRDRRFGNAPGACPVNRQGRGGNTHHPGRQSGLYRPRRCRSGRSDQEGRHHDPSGIARRRDVAAGIPGTYRRLITSSRGETPAPGTAPCCPSSP